MDEEHAWIEGGRRQLHVGGSTECREGGGARHIEYGVTCLVEHGEHGCGDRQSRAVIRHWRTRQYDNEEWRSTASDV